MLLEGVIAVRDHFELWPSPTEIVSSNIRGLNQTFSVYAQYYVISSFVVDC
ncbi:hypothetical protein CUJ84_pRLN3000492 (plasmid) [Rhizobium leguminosarum]|uniref:Uncharacterized protein n=1 Tax=Rhizobium leguminosarum TaxID=384 RepID=A0A2K9ZH74_RHILE|nr:hypothetical protein CUJ84_pRLN3000492 [Rhizobium leguminosarum]